MDDPTQKDKKKTLQFFFLLRFLWLKAINRVEFFLRKANEPKRWKTSYSSQCRLQVRLEHIYFCKLNSSLFAFGLKALFALCQMLKCSRKKRGVKMLDNLVCRLLRRRKISLFLMPTKLPWYNDICINIYTSFQQFPGTNDLHPHLCPDFKARVGIG